MLSHFVNPSLMASFSIGTTVSAVGDGEQSEAECHGSKTDSSQSFAQSIFVIRHGERLDSVDSSWQYKSDRPYDPPITEEGVKQAKEAGMRFLDKDIKFIVTSPFLRCLQTAQHICNTLGLPGVYTCNSIVDVLNGHCGINEQPVVPAEDIAQLGIKVLELDMTDLPRFPERTEEGLQRFRPAYRRLADLYTPHNLLIVTHGWGVHQVTEREGGSAVHVNYCGHVELQRASRCSPQWKFVDSKDVLWSA